MKIPEFDPGEIYHALRCLEVPALGHLKWPTRSPYWIGCEGIEQPRFEEIDVQGVRKSRVDPRGLARPPGAE